MRIMGIDLALKHTGIAVVESDDKANMKLIDCITIDTEGPRFIKTSCKILKDGLVNAVNKYKPDYIAVEIPVGARSYLATKSFVASETAFWIAMQDCKRDPHVYTPRTIAGLIGIKGLSGKDRKRANIDAALLLFPKLVDFAKINKQGGIQDKNEHIADACLLAFCLIKDVLALKGIKI